MKRYIKSAIKNISDEDFNTQRHVASDPATRVETLRGMADTNDYFMNLDLASNPSTPWDILDKFTDFRHYSSHIRAAVASNPSATKEMLYKLMKPGDPIVYKAIAENPITPLDLLEEITHKQSFEFSDFSPAQAAVARNPNATRSMLVYLAGSKNYDVRAWVARNPNTPDSVLRQLAQDERWDVRDSVTRNPRFSELQL